MPDMILDPFPQLYTPQAMMAGVRQLMPVRTFFKDTFFNTTYTHSTHEVKFDVFQGVRRIARYVNPILDATTVERQGFITKVTRPAYIKEKTVIVPGNTVTRQFGENPYQASEPIQRAAQILMGDLALLNERIIRREEVMCAQAIVDGKIIVQGDGWDAFVDFGYVDGVHTEVLTGGAGWNQATGDPLKYLDDKRLDIQKRSGLVPTHCILGRDAAWAFARNPIVLQSLKNTINQSWGYIIPENLDNGVTTYGYLTLPSGRVQLTSYNEWYRDPVTGQDVPLVPPDVCILANDQAACEFHYGLIQNMWSLQALPRWSTSWIPQDGKARFVQLESAPMPNLRQPDAFMVSHVLS